MTIDDLKKGQRLREIIDMHKAAINVLKSISDSDLPDDQTFWDYGKTSGRSVRIPVRLSDTIRELALSAHMIDLANAQREFDNL
jgi:hypothetical protein